MQPFPFLFSPCISYILPPSPATHHYPNHPLLLWISSHPFAILSFIHYLLVHLFNVTLSIPPSRFRKTQMYASRLCNVPTSTHPFCSLNNIRHYTPKYWSPPGAHRRVRRGTFYSTPHSSIAAEILLTKYENSGCPEQPECIELSGCRFARTSISALRRECNIWASSFLKESRGLSRCTKDVDYLPPRVRIRGCVV